jgi:hypothetical protein
VILKAGAAVPAAPQWLFPGTFVSAEEEIMDEMKDVRTDRPPAIA